MPPEYLIKRRTRLQKQLAEWYAVAQRPLPWRTEPSVYRTVISELMAQQTQINTMLPYFGRWMARFPNFEALAVASTEIVLKHWEGLGYYSRARNLHRLAQVWVAASPKPRSREEWQKLPGIGPYTSAAIASICFGEAVAVVDGNVVRVLARLTADQRRFKGNAEAVKALTPLANQLVAAKSPGDYNQAMMELGATICLKRRPLCTICPVSELCAGRADPQLEDLPRIERRATEQTEVDRAWIIDRDTILLHRIPETEGQLAGQYELPEWSSVSSVPPSVKPLARKVRSITHRRITETIYPAAPPTSTPRDCHWLPLPRIQSITLSGPHRKWVEELLGKRDARTSNIEH